MFFLFQLNFNVKTVVGHAAVQKKKPPARQTGEETSKKIKKEDIKVLFLCVRHKPILSCFYNKFRSS